MLALLAQAEAHFESVVSYEGDDADEIPAFEPLVAIAPLTGAGVQQALLVKVFGGSSVVAAYSVGQQIAIGAFSLAVGFVALVTIFQFRSFKEAIGAGKAARAEEGPKTDPDAPRAQA